MQGKKHSEETKRKISEKSKGNKAFLGRKHTEEWKQNRRKPKTRRFEGIIAGEDGEG